MKFINIGGAITALMLLAGCGASVQPSSATVRPATATSIPGTEATPYPTPVPTTAPTPNTLEGPVGTVYTITDQSNNSMNVTLTSVFNPRPAPYQSIDKTTHIVAAKFSITGASGIYTDDINGDATLLGSDGTTYSWWDGEVTNCSQFDSGQYTVTTQQTVSGCEVFQLPNGVTVKQVLWGTDPPAIWDV